MGIRERVHFGVKLLLEESLDREILLLNGLSDKHMMACLLSGRSKVRGREDSMKAESKVINIDRAKGFQLDPTLTTEEAIVLRALAAGKTDRQVCRDMQMAPETFLRMMSDVREKTSTASNLSLREWACEQMKGIDQRINKQERFGRPA
jgi:DNA-binding NarL/FixJ family response regulator